jgi:putative transposase
VAQYTSIALTEALHGASTAGSICSVGDALDNVLMESAVGLHKSKLIDSRPTFTGRACWNAKPPLGCIGSSGSQWR